MLTLFEIGQIVTTCKQTYKLRANTGITVDDMPVKISYNHRFTGKFGIFKLWKSVPWDAEIELSSKLFAIVPNEKQTNTVIHEYCHAIHRWETINGIKHYDDSPHGIRWQQLMILMGQTPSRVGIIPEGCVPPGNVKVKCKCPNGKHITKNRATRMKTGTVYHCLTCKSKLKLDP